MQVLKPGSRKFDINQNWKVLHPNGKHMFTTSQNRVNSYLKRDLAVVVDENVIQLTFNPQGEGFANDEVFGLLPRINQCVVCGATDNLQRHHVVPYHYRKFMPMDYKSRTHHDIALICKDHHEQYEIIAKDYKTSIARYYGVGTIEELNNIYITTVVERLRRKFKISKLLSTIIDNFNEIPSRKIEVICGELTMLVGFDAYRKTFDELELIQKKLAKAIIKEKREVMNMNDFFHGHLVINKFKSHADFEFFIKGWRRHFVETMKPEFMPEGWSIDFRCRK